MSLKQNIFTKLFNFKTSSQEATSQPVNHSPQAVSSELPSATSGLVKNAPKDIQVAQAQVQATENHYDNDFKTGDDSLTSSSTSSMPSDSADPVNFSDNHTYLMSDRETYNNINDLSVISEANESNLTVTSDGTNKSPSPNAAHHHHQQQQQFALSSPSFSTSSATTLTKNYERIPEEQRYESTSSPSDGYVQVEVDDRLEPVSGDIKLPGQAISSQPKLISSSKEDDDSLKNWSLDSKILLNPKTSSTPSPVNSNAKLCDDVEEPPVIGGAQQRQEPLRRSSRQRKSNRKKAKGGDLLDYKIEGWIKANRESERSKALKSPAQLDFNNNFAQDLNHKSATGDDDASRPMPPQVEINIIGPAVNDEDEADVEEQVQMQLRQMQLQKEQEFLHFRNKFEKLETEKLLNNVNNLNNKVISYSPSNNGGDSPSSRNSSNRSSQQSQVEPVESVYSETDESEKVKRTSSDSRVSFDQETTTTYQISPNEDIKLNDEFSCYSTNFLQKDHYNFIGTGEWHLGSSNKGSRASFRSIVSGKSTPQDFSGSESMLSNGESLGSSASFSSSDTSDPSGSGDPLGGESRSQYFQLSVRLESKQTLECILRTKNGNSIQKIEVVDDILHLNILSIVGRLEPNLRIKEIKPVVHPTAPEMLASYDRELVKSTFTFGMIYQKAGQTTEKEILDNVEHSAEFEEFINFIGQRIQLKNFAGFRGGLDKVNNCTGEYSVYEEFQETEIMFHVSTLLPHLPKDQQQLERKRHIGNDRVCLVFQDEYTPFTPDTIKSKLLHVFIVVQPVRLQDGAKAYQVSVISKNDVPIIEPLIPKPHVFKKSEELKRFLLTKLINAEYASLKAKAFKRFKVETIGASLSKLHAQLKRLTFEFTGEDFATCGNLENELKRAINRWPSTDMAPPSSPSMSAAPSSTSTLAASFLLHSPKQQLAIIQHLQHLYTQQQPAGNPEAGSDSMHDPNLSASQHHSSSFSNKIMKKYAFKPFQYLFNSSSNSKLPIGGGPPSQLNDSSVTVDSHQSGKPTSTASPASSSKPVTRTHSSNAHDDHLSPDSHFNTSTVSNPDTTLLSKIKHLRPEFGHSSSKPRPSIPSPLTTTQSTTTTPDMPLTSSLRTQTANLLPANLHLAAASPQIAPFIHSSSQANSTPVSRGPQRKTLREYVKKYIATSGTPTILPSSFPDSSPNTTITPTTAAAGGKKVNNKSSDALEAPKSAAVKESSGSGIFRFNSTDNLSSVLLKDPQTGSKNQKRQAPLAPAYSLNHLSSSSGENEPPTNNHAVYEVPGSAERFASATRLGEKQPHRKSKVFNLVSPKGKKGSGKSSTESSFASRLPFASSFRGKSLKTTATTANNHRTKSNSSTPSSSPYLGGKNRLSHPEKTTSTDNHLTVQATSNRYRCNSLDSTDGSNLSAAKASPQVQHKTTATKTSTN